MYKFLLCLRMLRQRRITWLCVAGVALGLGALIVVQSVMAGFATEVRERIKGTLSDLSISRGYAGFDKYEEILQVVRGVEGVKAASPVLEGLALIKIPDPELGADYTLWCRFWGIDPAAQSQVSRWAEWLNEGKGRDGATVFDLDGYEDDIPIVVGKELVAARIKRAGGRVEEKRLKYPGDMVVLMTIAFTFRSRDPNPTSYLPFTVADVWKSGMHDLDREMAFIPLEAAQTLRKMPDGITRIHVRLEDYGQAAEVSNRLHDVLLRAGFGTFEIATWEDERSPLLAAVALEQNLMVILLFLIIVVAGFMIMAILNMIVAEKVRDIGIVRALGGSRNGVAGIFLAFGMAIGVIGCVLGTIAGLLFTLNINAIERFIERITGSKVFDRTIYYFEKIPTVIDPISIASFAAGVLALCLLMSALPARRAARLAPIEAIRYE